MVRKININQNVILLSKPMPFLKPKNIMKNVKNLFEEFQKEAKSRIYKEEFEVLSADAAPSIWDRSYYGQIKISIDDMPFEFSINRGGYVADLSNHKIINFKNSPDEKIFKVLNRHFLENSKVSTEKEIEELEKRIKLLKNESNII